MHNIKNFEVFDNSDRINEMGKTSDGQTVNSPAGTWTEGKSDPTVALMIAAVCTAKNLGDYKPVRGQRNPNSNISQRRKDNQKEIEAILTGLGLLNPKYDWKRTIEQYENFMIADDQDISTLSKTQENIWLACRLAKEKAEEALRLGKKELNPYTIKRRSI